MLDRSFTTHFFKSIEGKGVRIITDGVNGAVDPSRAGFSHQTNQVIVRGVEHATGMLSCQSWIRVVTERGARVE